MPAPLRAVPLATAVASTLLAIATGCSRSPDAPAASAPAGAGPVQAASAGRAVYEAQGCARCHAINGQGGRMGPDLTRVGAQPGRTAEQLAEHVRNPKAHNPGSRMPAFEGKISEQDLKALGEYLASLK